MLMHLVQHACHTHVLSFSKCFWIAGHHTDAGNFALLCMLLVWFLKLNKFKVKYRPCIIPFQLTDLAATPTIASRFVF
jgi:hypothetical protein